MSRAASGLLALPLSLGLCAPASAAPERQVVLLVIHGYSYGEAVREPGLASLGGRRGAGLLTTAGRTGDEAYRALAAGGAGPGAIAESLRAAGRSVGSLAAPQSPVHLLAADASGRVEEVAECCDTDLVVIDVDGPFAALPPLEDDRQQLFVWVQPEAPLAADGRHDTTTPLIVATESRVCEPSCDFGLTSETTRRPGVISHVDIAPTVLAFLGVPVPDDMPGSPIRIAGERPDALHARYLDYRRSHPFADIAVPAAVGIALMAGLLALTSGRGVRTAHLLSLAALALPTALLPVSALPSLAPAAVIPSTLALAALLVWLALRAGGGTRGVAVLGAAGAGVVVLDGILGWPGLLMPLIGGSALDGLRFYGLGNGFGGLLVAGAVLAASLVPALGGVLLLLVAGFLGGAPWFGANLGVGVTLFAAAGLWFALRVRRGVVGLVAGGAIAAAALGLLLLAHRDAADPTHVTRALEAGGALKTLLHRLGLVIEGTNRVPAAWLFVLGLPAGLWVAWRRATPAGRWLGGASGWRDACIVLALAGIVGYLANDTYGVAAMCFTFLAGALLVPPLGAQWRA